MGVGWRYVWTTSARNFRIYRILLIRRKERFLKQEQKKIRNRCFLNRASLDLMQIRFGLRNNKEEKPLVVVVLSVSLNSIIELCEASSRSKVEQTT